MYTLCFSVTFNLLQNIFERFNLMASDSDDEMKRELARLRAENETLKQTKLDNISFKVGQKGGMSMYGLGRFPVTLYKSQWLILLDATDKIKEFLKDHEHELK